MSIKTELERLREAKDTLYTKMKNYGYSVSESDTLSRLVQLLEITPTSPVMSNVLVYIKDQTGGTTPTTLKSYIVNGENYMRLRDVGEAVDFNVYWDGKVIVDPYSPYTGLKP